MMEFIVRLFRALANGSRIRILRLLAVLGELDVAAIAQATALGATRVSGHLGILAAAGLIWRRRSGRAVGYRLAERPGNRVVAAALRALRAVFQAVREDEPQRVTRADQADSPTSSDLALFACFTAFTHPRRLQIIRHLERVATARLAELTTRLSMSPRACLRHLAKLERRGYLRRDVSGRQTTYVLARGEGSPQRALLRAVRQYLASTQE